MKTKNYSGFLTVALFLFLTANALQGQVSREAFDLSNGLNDLWDKNDPGPAVDSTLKLNKLYRPFFVGRMHDDFAQSVKGGSLSESKLAYLKGLYRKGDASVRSVVEPILLWNDAFKVGNERQADELMGRMSGLLGDSVNLDSKAVRYALLMLNVLDSKNLGSVGKKTALSAKVRTNLSRYPRLEQATGVRTLDEIRAWHRYLLAFAAYRSFQTDGGRDADLKDAARFSPDQTDRLYKHAYFYDANLLCDKKPVYDFKPFLFDRLVQAGMKQEALSVLLERCFAEPLEANMMQLKAFHAEAGCTQSLDSLWYCYVNDQMKPVPSFTFDFPDGRLDLNAKRSHWLFFDVWGTWCGPCCRELPDFNKLAAAINGDPASGLKVYSLSFSSTDLQGFLQKNNYTFPVVEVGREVTSAFGVTGYPTKILVSPENRYLIVPFGVNWPAYVKGYMLK